MPWVTSAARRMVPSPPMTTASSHSLGAAFSAVTSSTPWPSGRSSSLASSSSIRTTSPCAVSEDATALATSRASSRPVWASSRMRRTASGSSRSRVHLLTRHPQGRGTGHLGRDRVPVDLGLTRTQPEEELHVARRARAAGSWSRRGRPSHAARQTRATALTASARSPRSRTTPPLPSRSLPTSNCGLTIRARSPSGAVTPISASSTSSQRDEGQVTDDEVDRAAEQVRVDLPDVRPVVHPHAGVVAQRPDELAVAHVDRDHLASALAQEHVGEATRGRARVEAATPGHLETQWHERREGSGELVPAAARVVGPGGVLAHDDVGVGGHRRGRLGGRHLVDADASGGDQVAWRARASERGRGAPARRRAGGAEAARLSSGRLPERPGRHRRGHAAATRAPARRRPRARRQAGRRAPSAMPTTASTSAFPVPAAFPASSDSAALAGSSCPPKMGLTKESLMADTLQGRLHAIGCDRLPRLVEMAPAPRPPRPATSRRQIRRPTTVSRSSSTVAVQPPSVAPPSTCLRRRLGLGERGRGPARCTSGAPPCGRAPAPRARSRR